jgi:cell division inhibitor SulA
MNEAYIQSDLLHSLAYENDCTELDKLAKNESAAKEANVTEIIIAKSKSDSVQMLLPMLTRLNQEQRWLALIDPPCELLKRWKEERQADLDEIMVLRSNEKSSASDLCEKALATGTCHAAILWSQGLSNDAFERLEKASIEGDSHGIVVRSR